MEPSLKPGLNATLNYQVPEYRTVPHLLPESEEFAVMPSVLATGYLVGLVEWTCMQALAPHLPTSQRTLGVHVDLSHEAPTPPGSTVTIEAVLTAVKGRRLLFDVTAHDEAAIVCRGSHRRTIVDLNRFETTLTDRTDRS
ncbi:fluoroacetyl-CoA thioesterase [Streptomyces umbrinus]|uniref:Fluoroacetyl-CoA thioesterase n=1 Tax=Streptomyces umbrinus TaxID=67370 RepID=A0ABU0T192_9ACTN|nr:thioesterase family protein [Streptomyces umbrinus]MDQ1029468.1 fluoroacetyl-CoA thioesterase [Streptomyces umbrinus]